MIIYSHLQINILNCSEKEGKLHYIGEEKLEKSKPKSKKRGNKDSAKSGKSMESFKKTVSSSDDL